MDQSMILFRKRNHGSITIFGLFVYKRSIPLVFISLS